MAPIDPAALQAIIDAVFVEAESLTSNPILLYCLEAGQAVVDKLLPQIIVALQAKGKVSK